MDKLDFGGLEELDFSGLSEVERPKPAVSKLDFGGLEELDASGLVEVPAASPPPPASRSRAPAGDQSYLASTWETAKDVGQNLAEVPKGVPEGAVSMAGSALKGAAGLGGAARSSANALNTSQMDIFDRIDRGETLANTLDDIYGYQYMTPEQRAETRARVVKDTAEFQPTKVKETELYRSGQIVQDFARDLIPPAKGYEESLGRQVGTGLGSVAAGVAASAVSPAAAAGMFALTGSGEAVDRAVKAGASDDDIITAARAGLIPGLSDSVPIEMAMGRLPLPGGKLLAALPAGSITRIADAIGRIGQQAFVEGLQEGGQQFLQNLIAREVHSPDQALVDGVAENASVGAVVGGVVESALTPFRRRGGASSSPETPAVPDGAMRAEDVIGAEQPLDTSGLEEVPQTVASQPLDVAGLEEVAPLAAPVERAAPASTPSDEILLGRLASHHNRSHIDGMQDGLKTGLGAMIQGAPPEISAGLGIMSGYRSPGRQAEIIADGMAKYGLGARRGAWEADVAAMGPEAAGQKWRATFREAGLSANIGMPGGSKHQHGQAADLTWNGQRLDKAPREVREWVHANAAQFGLHFPLDNEAWHVEAAGSRSGTPGAPSPTDITSGGAGMAAVPQLLGGDATRRTARAVGVGDADFANYGAAVATIEGARYDQMGGSSDKYAGKYQMGPDAITDAARVMGIARPSLDQFLADGDLQEEMFDAYTAFNNDILMGNERYAAASPAEKLQILGYAHNQGAGGAMKWLDTGVAGKDAFGTAGTKYFDAVGAAIGGSARAPVPTTMEGMLSDPRSAAEMAPNVEVGRTAPTQPNALQAMLDDPRSAKELRAEYEERGEPDVTDVGLATALPVAITAAPRASTAPLLVAPSSDLATTVAPEAISAGTRTAPVVINTPEAVNLNAGLTAQPTPAQAEAGNYQKRHIKFDGLDISIETEQGQQRTGTDANGNEWSVTMPAAYGYVKRTKGADGDHVDVYVGGAPTGSAYVVDQIDPSTGRFDEHKVMLGYQNEREALAAYEAAFSDGRGRARIGAVKGMTQDEFRRWLSMGNTRRPVAYQAPTKAKKIASRAPADLVQFLARQGGLRDFRGELAGLDLRNAFVPGAGRLLRQNGMSLDRAREMAAQAGYLGTGDATGTTTVRDLLDAIDANQRGQRRFAEGDADAVRQAEQDRADEEDQRVRQDLDDVIKESGANLRDGEKGEMLDLVAQGVPVDDAFVMVIERNALAYEADLQDIEAKETPADERIPFDDERGAERPVAEAPPQGEQPEGPQRGGSEGGAPARGEPRSREPDQEPAQEVAPTTEQGGQTVLIGAERISRREEAERAAARPKRAQAEQRDMDVGMFGSGVAQTDLLDIKPAASNRGQELAQPARPAPQAVEALQSTDSAQRSKLGQKLKAPKLPDTQAARRASKIIGATIGDTVTPSEAIGYSTANESYVVTEINKTGEVFVRAPDGAGTSWTRASLEGAARRGVTFRKEAANDAPVADAQPSADAVPDASAGKAGRAAANSAASRPSATDPALAAYLAAKRDAEPVRASDNRPESGDAVAPARPAAAADRARDARREAAADDGSADIGRGTREVEGEPEPDPDWFSRAQIETDPAEASARVDTLFKRFRADLDKMGLRDTRLQLVRSMRIVAQMERGTIRQEIDGLWAGDVITVALQDNSNPTSTLHHEAIHGLARMNVLTADEMRVLQKTAERRWMKRYRIAERYADFPAEVQVEEAIAHAYGEWAAGRSTEAGMIARLFTRIRDFLAALRRALTDAGYQTPGDVFRDIRAGTVGGRSVRADNDAQSAGARASLRSVSLADVEDAAHRAGVSLVATENGQTITLSKIVVPEAARGQGIGRGIMEALNAYADQAGKRIVLTPSADFGGKVTRLRRFYRELGFVENKGRMRDFTTREAMIREPNRPLLSTDRFFSLKDDPQTAGERNRVMQGMLARGQPIDRAMRVPFDFMGGLDRYGRWNPAKRLTAKAWQIVSDARFDPEGRFAMLNPYLHAARSGWLDRHGLSEEYKALDKARSRDERRIMMEGAEILKTIAESNLSVDENRVLQAMLTDKSVTDADMAKLAEPIRVAIDNLGQEAVVLGLISQESFERNRGAYLNRSYLKYEAEQDGLSRLVNRIMGSKRKQIIGNQLKGRGIFLDVQQDRLLRDTDETALQQRREGELRGLAKRRAELQRRKDVVVTQLQSLNAEMASQMERRMDTGEASKALKRPGGATVVRKPSSYQKGQAREQGVAMNRLRDRVEAAQRVLKRIDQKMIAAAQRERSITERMANTEIQSASVGDKFVVLDLIGDAQGDEPGKVTRRVYWPAGRKVPDRFDGYRNSGTWEVRAKRDGSLTIWRDYTKEERGKMGEILDARYTIGKTYMQMSHDLATGRFYRDIAANDSWVLPLDETPPEGSWKDGAEYKGRLWADESIGWVRVPETAIPGTGNKKRWGALSGRFIRAEIWRDLNELQALQQGNFWTTLLAQWKMNKTIRNPVVHMNNVMSNLMFMDLADIRAQDLVAGLRSFVKKDDEWKAAFENGAFGSDMVSSEFRDNVLQPILDDMLKDMQGGATVSWFAGNRAVQMLDKLVTGIKAADQFMQDAYQVEDMVFRMAAFVRRRSLGDDVVDASQYANDVFLDYDIRAPWVNAARRTVLPFFSYIYRSAPLIASAIAHRPWKLAKYMAVAHAVTALAYAATGDDDDDKDREQGSFRKEAQGETWLGVPRMARMPWRDENGMPVFLDIRRWIPAGDVFDVGQGQTALPIPAPLMFGGPLMLGAEFMLNRSAFTGDDIVNTKTDDFWDKTEKVGDWAWKAWMPSAPWVPNSWYWEKIGLALAGAEDSLGRAYSVPQAVASSVGIKLAPQDVEQGYRFQMRELVAVDRELRAAMRDTQRKANRKILSPEAAREQMDTLREKAARNAVNKRKLAAKARGVGTEAEEGDDAQE